MPVQTLKEIRSRLSAEENKFLDNLFAKEKELEGGWLRQDDYSRHQNEFKAKETEFNELKEYKEKQEPWAQKIWNALEEADKQGLFDLENGEEKFTATKAELEKQLEDLKALGGDMDPKKLEEVVTAKVQEISRNAGGLTKDEITALFRAETKNAIEEGFKAREADFNSKTIPFIAGFAAANAVVSSRYEKESGEKWTPEKQVEFFEMMSKENKFDPYALEEKLLAPAKARAEEKKQREKEIQEAIEKDRKDRGYGMPGGGSDRNIPQPTGNDARGLLQKALDESGGDKTPKDVRDLVREGVVEGAKELVESGSF